mgnify:FL=1
MLGRNRLTRGCDDEKQPGSETDLRLVCDGICEGGEQVKVKV